MAGGTRKKKGPVGDVAKRALFRKKWPCRIGLMSPYPDDVALRFAVLPCQADSLPCILLLVQVACQFGRLIAKLEKKGKKNPVVDSYRRYEGKSTWFCPMISRRAASTAGHHGQEIRPARLRRVVFHVLSLKKLQSVVHSAGGDCSIPCVMARKTSSSSSNSRLSACHRISRVRLLWRREKVLALTTRSRQEKNIS